MPGLLLPSSNDDAAYGSIDIVASPYQSMGNSHWETLEFYLVSTLFCVLYQKHIVFGCICAWNASKS